MRADADHEPELFWALRGGGGNFGAVTALEFCLYPVERVYAGSLIWPWEDAQRVLHRWAELTRTAPEAVMSVAHVRQLPDLEVIPEPVRGRDIVILQAAYLGDEAGGRELLRPLRELGRRWTPSRWCRPSASCGWPATPRARRPRSSTGRSCTLCRRTRSTHSWRSAGRAPGRP